MRPPISLPEQLQDMICGPIFMDDGNLEIFRGYHHSAVPELKLFLNASMDEVRLFHAEQAAEKILQLSDIDDSSYFRKAVLLRELTASMGYEKQRDHAAHTVHNYLLGWFFVLNSTVIREEVKRQFTWRLGAGCVVKQFTGIWGIPSLLHDIGYLFEGSVRSNELSLGSDMALKGAKYANEFFSHHFWEAMKVQTKGEKDCIQKLAGVNPPSISGNSIIEIADALRQLPALRAIQKELDKSALNKGKHGECPQLEFDAFRLWEQNYRYFGNTTMADRVGRLRTSYEELLTRGLPKLAVRVLDHGVSGALLQLQVSAFWFEVFFQLRDHEAIPKLDARVKELFCERPEAKVDIDIEWFWAAIVWNTAAVAFHNIAQTGETWPGTPVGVDLRISVEDDVLTYLGILVDVLEEWDRYSMHRNSVFTGVKSLPVQSKDVDLGAESDGRIIIKYPNVDIANDVRKAMNKSLLGWEKIVDIQPSA